MATLMKQIIIRVTESDVNDLDEISAYHNVRGRSAAMRLLIRQEIRRIRGDGSVKPAADWGNLPPDED